MIILTIDGLNFRTANELYLNLFPEQTMKMIKCDVRTFTDRGVNGTPIGLTCLWSGERIKNLHENFLVSFGKDGFNEQYKWLDKDNNELDLIWKHFDRCKYYEKVVGDSPYSGKQYWNHYHSLKQFGVKFPPCEELCIFSEIAKNDYDLFWIHSSIVKTGTFSIGPYEMGRHPAIVPYDTIRKDKVWKRNVYMLGVERYKQVIEFIKQTRPNDIIIITSDHGTWTDMPFTYDQIDEIPLIVNRDINIDDIRFQWNVKDFIIKMKEYDKA